MSESVDTRVVEAKFDSEQFEKGVDKTVKKLDELKKSLNLKDAGDSIAELADKTQKASTKASESLEKLETRFTSFAGMMRQKFLSGIADEIVGVFFRIKSSFEGLVHSLSSAQVSYGMQRYNDILTSVRTLVSAGESQDTSYKVIERLGDYADQTSYSLDALVSTMSKFKTSGASLSTAQRMVEGLSNAAASMGVNAQDAQRAYLNLQQAYSKGAMLQNDWISFESIPMVGTKFNQRILEAAVAVGTLEEDKKNGGYKTKGGKGSEVKTKGADTTGINAENLGTKLSSRWFNKAVMEKVFGEMYYFSIVDVDKVNAIKDVEDEYNEQLKANIITQEQYNQKMDEYFEKLKADEITEKQEELNELLKNNKITQEEYDKELREFTSGLHIDRFSWEAFRAGQEARSLTDVLNTLKDVISRGWAQSFEYLFGKLDEASKLFTKMTESNIAEAIYAIGEFRNEILRGWSLSGGRDSLLRTLKTIDDMVGSIFTKIGLLGDEEETVIDKQKAFNDRFEQLFDQKRYDLILSSENEGGGLEEAEKYRQSIIDQINKEFGSGSESVDLTLGDRLAVLSRDIADFMEKVSKWVNEHIDPILERIHAVNAAISKLFGSGFGFVVKTLRTVSPLLNTLYSSLMKISQPFFDMINPDVNTQSYKDIDNILNNINKVVGILVDPLSKISSILADVIAFIVEMGTSTVTANLSFISDTIGFVLEVLGIGSSQQEKGEGVLDGIVKSVQDLGNACKDAFGAVRDFFSEVLDGIRNFLGIKDKDGNIPEGGLFQRVEKFFETNQFVQDVKKKIDDAIKSIGDFIRDLPNKIADIPNVFGRLINDLFYEVDENTGEYKVEVGEDGRAKPVKTAFKRWLDQVSEAIWNFITVDIPEFVSSIPNFFGRLINDLFYEINEDTGEYKVEVGEDGKARPVRTALKLWLDNAVEIVKNFITVDIPKFVKSIPSIISSFFNSLFYEVEKDPNTGEILTSKGKVKLVKTPLKEWLDQAVKDAKQFITKDIPNKLKKIPSAISTFFHNLFYTVKKDKEGNILLEGKGKPVIEQTDLKNWLDQAVKDVTKIINDFILDLPNKINQGINAVGNFINVVVGAIFGKKNGEWVTPEEVQEKLEAPFKNINLTWIIDSIKSIGTTILNNIISIFTGSTDWETNKNSLAEGVANAVSWIEEKAKSAWDTAKDWFINLPNTIASFFTENSETGEPSGVSKVWSSITTFAEGIGKAILGIPDTIKKFWDNAEHALGGYDPKLYDKLLNEEGYLNAQYYKDSHKSSLFDFLINKIGEGISSIVDAANEAWPKVEKWFTDIPGNISKFFSGDSTTGEPSGISQMLQSIRDFGGTIGKTLLELPGIIESFWVSAQEELSKNILRDDFDQKLYDQIYSRDPKIAERYKNEHTNPILEFFRQLISNIGHMFTTIGPTILDGINTALSWIGGKIGQFTEWLGKGHEQGKSIDEMIAEEMSGEEKGEGNPLWQSIQSIGQTIFDFMTKTIPKFIEEAIAEIKLQIPKLFGTLFGGKETKESVETSAKEALDFENLTVKQQREYLKEQEAAKQVNTSGAVSFLEMLLGISSASAESIEGIEDATEQFNGGGASHSFETKREGIQAVLGGLGDIFTSIHNLVNAASNDKILTFAVILVAFAAVLEKIKDITSLTDEIYAVSDALKWAAIAAVITGITTLMGYLVVLASQGEAGNEKLKAVKAVLEDFKNLIVPILRLIAVIVGATTLGKFFDWREEAAASKKDATQLSGIKDILLNKASGILDIFGSFSGTLGKMLGISVGVDGASKAVENITDNLADSLTHVGQGIENFSEYAVVIVERLKSANGDLTTAINSIDLIKELITKMIGLLTTDVFDQEGNIIDRVSTDMQVGVIVDIFNRINGMFALFTNSISIDSNKSLATDALKTLVDMESDMRTFTEFANSDVFEDFKMAIASLGGIMQLYSLSNTEDFNKPLNDQNVDNAIGLLKQLFLNDDLKDLITSFDEELLPDEKEMLNVSERIVIFAGALASIARACGALTGTEDQSINKLITFLNGLTLKTENENKLLDFSGQFGILGNALNTFASETKDVENMDLTTVTHLMNRLLEFAVGLNELPSDAWIVQLIAGNKEVGNFGEGIQQLGGNIKAFYDAVANLNEVGESQTFNEENVYAALYIANKIADVASKLTNTDVSENSAFANIGDHMTEFVTGIGTFIQDFMTLKDEYSGILDTGGYVFIDEVIDMFSSIMNAIPATVGSYYSDAIDKMNYVMDALIGKDNISGFLGRLQWAGESGQFHFSSDSSMQSFISTLKQVVDIVYTLSSSVTMSGFSMAEDRIMYLSEALFGYNNKSGFIGKLSSIGESGVYNLDSVQQFIDILWKLSEALQVFSKTNEEGDYEFTEGLKELMRFDGWNQLFGEDGLSPKITPQLEITEEFKQQAEALRAMIDPYANANAGTFDQSTYDYIQSLDSDRKRELAMTSYMEGRSTEAGYTAPQEIAIRMAEDQVSMIKPIDYTNTLTTIKQEVVNLKSTTAQLGSRIAQMRFEIDGRQLAQLAGPYFDAWLGEEGYYAVRGNINNAVSLN